MDFHYRLACVHVDKRHWDAVFFNGIQQKHNTVTDLKFRDFFVFKNVLQLVGLEGPHTVGVLCRMFRYDLGIKLIELNEVWVAEAEILEQLSSFNPAAL